MIKRAYLELHIAVFLFGFTAILGHLIQLSAVVLVWWRVLIAVFTILAFTKTWSKIRLLPRRLVVQYFGIGCILMGHWLCFYGAIKWANASVALICLATTSFMSAILEPLMNKKRIKWFEVSLGIIIIPSMFFIGGSLPKELTSGLWLGLMSAVLSVFFTVINKKLISKTDPLSITLLEFIGGGIFLTILLPFYLYFDKTALFLPSNSDWIYLIILALVCTNIAYVLATRALVHLSAFASNLTINLEPIYGILMAIVLLKEDKQLSPAFYIGAALILMAVLSYPILKKRFDN